MKAQRQKRVKEIGKVLVYSFIPVAVLVAVHYATYDLAMILVPADATTYTLNTVVDDLIPFQPVWIIAYVGDYFFNLLLYFLAGLGDRRQFGSFCWATIVIQVIAFFFFVFLPVAPPRPEILGTDFWSNAVRDNYATDLSYNCFPSLHCGLTVLAYLGIRGVKRIPAWFRAFSFMFCIAVCLSTLFLKQHYFVDAVFGIALSLGLYWGAYRFGWYKPLVCIFDWLNKHTWGYLLKA